MNRYHLLIRKIYTSTPALVLMYGFPFGIATYLVSDRRTYETAIVYIVGGLIFGLFMSLSQKKRFHKSFQINDKYKIPKQKKISQYLRHAIVPTAKSEKRSLMVYMDKIEARQKALNLNYYPKPYSKVVTYGFLLAVAIFSLYFERSTVLTSMCFVFFAVGLIGEYIEYVRLRQIKIMRDKLNAKNDTA